MGGLDPEGSWPNPCRQGEEHMTRRGAAGTDTRPRSVRPHLCRRAGHQSTSFPKGQTAEAHETTGKEQETGRQRYWCRRESKSLPLQEESGGSIVVRPSMPSPASLSVKDMIPREDEFGCLRVEDPLGDTTNVPSAERVSATHPEKQGRKIHRDRRTIDRHKRGSRPVDAGGKEREGAMSPGDWRNDLLHRLILTHHDSAVPI